MRQNSPHNDEYSYEEELVSDSDGDYESDSEYIVEEIIEDDEDNEEHHHRRPSPEGHYHDDDADDDEEEEEEVDLSEEEEVVLSEDEEVVNSCDGSSELFDTVESPEELLPEPQQQQDQKQSEKERESHSQSNSRLTHSESHSVPIPHERSQIYEVETVVSSQSETSTFYGKPEPSQWDAETNSLQPTVTPEADQQFDDDNNFTTNEGDNQNDDNEENDYDDENNKDNLDDENNENNDDNKDNFDNENNDDDDQDDYRQHDDNNDTIDDNINNYIHDDVDRQQGNIQVQESAEIASHDSRHELPMQDQQAAVPSGDTEPFRTNSIHGPGDPTHSIPSIHTKQPLQEGLPDKVEPDESTSMVPSDNNHEAISRQNSDGTEAMPMRDQVPRESISSPPVSPQKTTLQAIRRDSVPLPSPKPRPMPKPREPEESVMHQYVDQGDWPQLLKFMEKLRKQSSSVVAKELTKTDPAARATVLHRIIAKAPLMLTKLLISIVPFDARFDILMLPDMHGNTPLHTACATLQIQPKTNSIDDTIIKTLSVGSPEAHHVQNQQGDIPLSLLLTAPAMKATTDPELLAVESQAEDLVRRILHEQPDLSSAQNKSGQTLLHVAINHRVHERVSILLLDNASYAAGLSDSQGKLPIHHVAATTCPDQNPPLSLVERLIVGAPEGLTAQCSMGNTPLHWMLITLGTSTLPFLQEHVTYAMEQFTEMLLGRSNEESQCPLLVKNKGGLAPLHCCALHQVPTSIVQILIRSHFATKAVNTLDIHMATPLHVICESANITNMVEQISLLGTHCEEASVKKDDKGHTPLHLAAQNSHCTDTVIQAVIDINPKAAKIENNKGRLPVHLAIRNRASESVLNALLRASPKAVKSIFEGNNGVIHEMCQYKAPSAIIELALHLFPEGARLENKFHNLPLHVATAYQCDLSTVKALIKAFPQACTHQNKRKDVPLHYAIIYRKAEAVIDLLIKTAPSAVMIPNEKDQTPLDLSKENGTGDIAIQALDEVSKLSSRKKRSDIADQETAEVAKVTTSKKLDSFQATLERARTFKVPSKATQKESTPKDKAPSSSRDLNQSRSRSKSRDDKRGRSKSRDKSETKRRDKSVDKEKDKSVEREGRTKKREKDKKSSKRSKSVDTSKSGSYSDSVSVSDSDEEAMQKHASKSLRHMDHKPRKNDKDNDKGKKKVGKSLQDLDYKPKKRDKSVEPSKSRRDSDEDEKKSKKKVSKSLRNLDYNSMDTDDDEKKSKKKTSKSRRNLEYNSKDSDDEEKKSKKKASKSLRNLDYNSMDTDDDERKSKKKASKSLRKLGYDPKDTDNEEKKSKKKASKSLRNLDYNSRDTDDDEDDDDYEKKSKKKASKSLRNLEYKPKKALKDESSRRDNYISKSLSNLNSNTGESSDEDSNPKKSKSKPALTSRQQNTKNGKISSTDEKRMKPKRSQSTTQSELRDTNVGRKIPRSSSDNIKYDKPPKSPRRPPLSPGTLVRKKSKASLARKEEIADGSIKELTPTASVFAALGTKRSPLIEKTKSQSSAPVEETPARKNKKSILKTSAKKDDHGEVGVLIDKESLKQAFQKKSSKSLKDDSLRSDSRKEKKKKRKETSKQHSDESSEDDSLTPQSPRSRRRSTKIESSAPIPSRQSSKQSQRKGNTTGQSKRASLLDELLSPFT